MATRLELYSEFKQFVDDHSISVEYVEFTDRYYLSAEQGSISFIHILPKDGHSNQTDFESNYKSAGNSLPRRSCMSILGSTDNSKIGNVGDRLKVDAQVTPPSSSDNVGCPTISDKLKIEHDGTDIIITSSYVTLYNYSGSGKLFGMALDFNSNRVKIKLTVDSNVIFDLPFQTIEDIARFGGGSDKGSNRDLCGFFRIGASDRIEFCPPCPMAYDSQILVEAVRYNTSTNRKLTEKMVFLTKET